jgi:hypothetical protein
MGKERSRVLILVEPRFDYYGTHHVSSRLFAAEYLRWGFRPTFLDISNPAHLRRAEARVTGGDVAFVHCEQGHGLNLGRKTGSEESTLLEVHSIPAIAHLRDYPFVPTQLKRLASASSTAVLFHADAMGPEIAKSLGLASGQHHFAPHVYLDYRQPDADALSSARRDIDVLYVGSYKEPASFREKFRELHPDLVWAYDDLVNAAIGAFHRPIHRILFQDILSSQTGHELSRDEISQLLFHANQFVRYERRRKLFVALARHPVDMVWAGPVPQVPFEVKARVRPAIPLTETLDLLCRSRYMVMALNNFSHGLSERLLSAMARGCVPITQSNALIDQSFRDGEHLVVLQSDLGNLDPIVAQAQSKGEFAAMSSAARARVMDEFSPATRVRQMLSHLNLTKNPGVPT